MTAGQAFRNTVIVLATLVSAYVLLMSARILVVLIIAIFIASAVRPFVLRLVSWRVPEGLAILITYVLLVVGILTLFLLVIPPIVNQAADYMQNETRLASRIIYSKNWLEQALTDLTANPVSLVDDEQVRTTVSGFVDQMRTVVPHMLTDLGGTLAEAVLAIVMGVYWLTSRDKAVQFILQLFPHRSREEVGQVITEIESSVGNYIGGMVMVASFVGLVNFAILPGVAYSQCGCNGLHHRSLDHAADCGRLHWWRPGDPAGAAQLAAECRDRIRRIRGRAAD